MCKQSRTGRTKRRTARKESKMTEQDPQQVEPHGNEPVNWEEKCREAEAKLETVKAESRKWEARSKENKEKADRLDELESSNAESVKKAQEAEAAASAARIEAEEAKAALERMNLVSRIAEEKNVPASLLVGDTEEALSASADALLKFAESSKPSYPKDKGGASSLKSLTPSFDDIKDPVERIKARARAIEENQ